MIVLNSRDEENKHRARLGSKDTKGQGANSIKILVNSQLCSSAGMPPHGGVVAPLPQSGLRANIQPIVTLKCKSVKLATFAN